MILLVVFGWFFAFMFLFWAAGCKDGKWYEYRRRKGGVW